MGCSGYYGDVGAIIECRWLFMGCRVYYGERGLLWDVDGYYGT